ncbi:LLM class flavin-dependent oxidoreductase [Micromonospora sp. NPDC093277]|uniref:LLM class flavin-dependent oxidoreductase n=1 Tax=Micromonospora sp. NPDC093277 TaxID=3364291 RepID=UPI0038210482
MQLYAFDVYGTALQPSSDAPEPALTQVAEFSRRAEANALTGVLIFYNHRTLDPWAMAAAIMHQTQSLVPLVALQPYALPPFAAAKMISSLTRLHRRRLDLNVIIGSSPDELVQVDDALGHEDRYARASEYLAVLRRLLSSDEPVDADGRYYRFRGLRMECQIEPALRPRIFVAGSSEASRKLAEEAADVMVTHPEPVDQFTENFLAARRGTGPEIAVRLGLLARETGDEAWEVARKKYTVDRMAVARTALMRESESDWSRRLAQLSTSGESYDGVYSTALFRSGKAAAPLLVGSYDTIADYLGRYFAVGISKLLLSQVDSDEDYRHVQQVLTRVRRTT